MNLARAGQKACRRQCELESWLYLLGRVPCASRFPEGIGKLSLSEVSRLTAHSSALCAISSQVRAERVGGCPALQRARSAGAWLGPGLARRLFS